MKITHDQVTEIERGLYQLDLDVDQRTDYSGRNMYGRTCLGFEVDDTHRLMYCLGRLLQSAIPPEHWHPAPDDGWAEWYVEHFKLLHPEVRRWHP